MLKPTSFSWHRFSELRPIPPSDAVGEGEKDVTHNRQKGMKMPGISSRVVGAPPAAVPANGFYPKLLQGRVKNGRGGSVWLVTSAKTGTIVQLAVRPQKDKHKLGYYTTRLDETKMDIFRGKIELDGSTQATR